MSHFIVQTAAAHMPTSCKGVYKRVAVLEVEDGLESVSMISERAKGCIEVVATWEKLNVGTTDKCAFRRAVKDADEMAARLNKRAARNAARRERRRLLAIGSEAFRWPTTQSY